MNKIEGTINSENNPTWPPSVDKYILIQKKQICKYIYAGKVIKILDNNVGVIVKLSNDFEYPYSNNDVKLYLKPHADPKKFMIVIETDGWRYTNEDKIDRLVNIVDETVHGSLPKKQKELLYDDISYGKATLSNKYYHQATDNPDPHVPLHILIESNDLDDFAFLHKLDNIDDLNLGINATVQDTTVEDTIPDKVKSARQEILDSLEKIKPDQTDDKINLIKPQDLLIIDQMMINTFVSNTETLKTEASKIIEYLNKSLFIVGENAEKNNEKLYETIKFIYHNGYIHIFREGIPLKELITHELLNDSVENPKIKKLGENEYNSPIRHDVLKYILFQNAIQRSLASERQILLEAELLLSQEYIIALTPEPRYQIWCVLRLIKLWYGDEDLQNNIRKIKLLVNQYRARSDKEYNINNGIQVSIGIYPRYGKDSAVIVLKKMMYYFSLYFGAIGWKNNPPSYFKVVNDLISYTNCDQALKLYYRKMVAHNGQPNTVFSKNFTKINSGDTNTDILEQYVPLSS